MSRITLGLVIVIAAACNNSVKGDPHGAPDAATAPHADASHAGSVAPHAGTWSYSDTPVSNTCPPNTPTDEAGTFVIDQVTAATFRIVPGDGTPAFPCSYDAAGFACPDRLSHVEDLRPGIDAIVTVHATASGSFSSPTQGTGNQSATATCTGSQCDVLGAATFPCGAKVQFVITGS